MSRFGKKTVALFFATILLPLITLICTHEMWSPQATGVDLSIYNFAVRPEEGANSNKLLHLDSIPWPNAKRPNISSNLMVERLGPFDIKMSLSQYATLEKLIAQFEQVMISLKLQEVAPGLAEEFILSTHKFNLSDIFPLTYRPFGKHWYPAPRRPVSYLRKYYSTQRQYCSSHTYSHALEKEVLPKYMDCRKLMERYAFVHRCPISEQERNGIPIGLCDEHLVDGNGRSVHKIRTALDYDEIEMPLYTV